MTLRLYFVAYEDEGDENHDHFIRANSADEAIRLWLQMEPMSYSYDGYKIVPAGEGQVFIVPDQDGPEGVVGWDHNNSVQFDLI